MIAKQPLNINFDLVKQQKIIKQKNKRFYILNNQISSMNDQTFRKKNRQQKELLTKMTI